MSKAQLNKLDFLLQIFVFFQPKRSGKTYHD